jgi:hypothetical protein
MTCIKYDVSCCSSLYLYKNGVYENGETELKPAKSAFVFVLLLHTLRTVLRPTLTVTKIAMKH